MILSQSIPNVKSNDEELIVLTKTKHDALRKDIEDYKNLLIRYQSIKIDYETTLADLERQSKTSEKTFDELKRANIQIASMENEVESLKAKILEMGQKYSELDKSYRHLNGSFYDEKSKVIRMQKGQTQVYIWKGLAVFFFLCIFIVQANN